VLLKRSPWIALAVIACSGPGDADGGAGIDSGLVMDAGHDSGMDAGTDAGGGDSGPDDPGWEPWIELADDCVVERATNPEATIPPWRWQACSDPADSCWEAPGGGGKTGWFDGEIGYLVSGVIHSGGSAWVQRAITRTLGPTLAAWRFPSPATLVPENRSCQVSLAVGDGHAALIIEYVDFDDSRRSRQMFYFGSLSEIAAVEEPILELESPIAPQEIAVTSELIAVWTGGAVVAIDPAGGGTRRMNEPLSGIPQNLSLVGSHVLWEDWADVVRIAHGDPITAGSLFHQADPGDIKGFQTDGERFAWFQGYDRQPDRSYDRLELWTAPYVRDPATLEPRMVREMEARNASAYGGGWYVVVRSDPRRLDIVNVEDGTLRQWIPAGGVSTPPLYVSENEILAQSGNLVRFDPHALPVVAE